MHTSIVNANSIYANNKYQSIYVYTKLIIHLYLSIFLQQKHTFSNLQQQWQELCSLYFNSFPVCTYVHIIRFVIRNFILFAFTAAILKTKLLWWSYLIIRSKSIRRLANCFFAQMQKKQNMNKIDHTINISQPASGLKAMKVKRHCKNYEKRMKLKKIQNSKKQIDLNSCRHCTQFFYTF